GSVHWQGKIRFSLTRAGVGWGYLWPGGMVAIAILLASGLTLSAQTQQTPTQVPAAIVHNWGWFLAFGIGLVVLGIIAIFRSVAATVASMLFFGWLLLIAAAIEIAQTVMVGQWGGVFQHLVAAILFGVVGFLMILRPVVT